MLSSIIRRQHSVHEIKELAERLKSKPEDVTAKPSAVGQVGSQVFLPVLLEDVVNQKQVENRNREAVQIMLLNESKSSDVFTKVNGVELRSVISNLINNAIESYGDLGGTVTVMLSASDRICSISVIDKGCGVCPEQLQKLGFDHFTSKQGEDHGLGLTHAVQTVESWGGRIKFYSEVGLGTRVTIEMPRHERAGLLQRLSLLAK